MSKNIDKIIYINLKRREDRKLQIENELNSFNLSYERFEATEIVNHGILGCGYSHLGVLKLAKERNYNNILILEDDFVFTLSKEDFESHLEKFFDLQLQYDVFMLVYNEHQHIQPTEHPFLSRIITSSNASAYIVNNSYYDTLIELLEINMPLLEQTKQHWNYANDQVWCRLQQQNIWYGIKPLAGKQRSSSDSDTTDGFSSY
jgi:glycosyl transferase family 25